MRTLWKVILHKPVAQSDAVLLQSFVTNKSESAFALLVERHGGMVLGVCQRVLGHTQDAEDAFQAVFLVLAQKASKLHGNTSLGPWLYGVAQRVALKARSRRTVHAPLVQDPVHTTAPEDAGMNVDELRPMIDEEIAHLPEHYRAVFVLCQLQDLTRAEAARQLGCPEGTISSRLMRARELLRSQLLKRGVALSSLALLEVGLLPGSVPAQLAASTASLATMSILGVSLSTHVSSTVLHLTQGAAPAMVLSKIQLAAVGVVIATGLSLGTGYVAGGWGQDKDSTRAGAASTAVKPRETTAKGGSASVATPSNRLTNDQAAAVAQLEQVNPKMASLFNENLSLDDWLRAFEDQNGLVSVIDQAAFRDYMFDIDMKLFRQQQLTLPRMTNQSTGTMLRTLLDSLTCNNQAIPATYLIRRGTLVIVPKEYVSTAASKLTVSLETKNGELSLYDAFEELSKDTGISIIVDSKVKDKVCETRTSNSFRNIKLINAVRLLANMAELTVINIDGALFVSTSDNCRAIEEEINKGMPVPAKGP